MDGRQGVNWMMLRVASVYSSGKKSPDTHETTKEGANGINTCSGRTIDNPSAFSTRPADNY